MKIGFSTGSLAHGDFLSALDMLEGSSANAIELSALREFEFEDLISFLGKLNLSQYKYISFHVPSKLINYSEQELISLLQKVIERELNIIVHPDIIQDARLWKSLGSYVCIENMDKRKLIGRTSADLDEIFTWLPDASFCLDLAHARQVDPTMIETVMMLKKFGNRLKQIHLSDVNSRSFHEPLNLQALISYKLIAYLIDKNIPIILETPVTKDNIEIEIQLASLIFNEEKFANFFQSVGLYLNQSTGRVKAAF
jgi:hypothetical protein